MTKWLTLILIHLVIMITQTHILMKVKIFLLPQEERWEEDLLGNQTENEKPRLKERVKDGSSQRTRQSIVSCAIQKPGANPRSISFRQFRNKIRKTVLRDKSTSLTIRGGKLRSFGEIARMLSKEAFVI